MLDGCQWRKDTMKKNTKQDSIQTSDPINDTKEKEIVSPEVLKVNDTESVVVNEPDNCAIKPLDTPTPKAPLEEPKESTSVATTNDSQSNSEKMTTIQNSAPEVTPPSEPKVIDLTAIADFFNQDSKSKTQDSFNQLYDELIKNYSEKEIMLKLLNSTFDSNQTSFLSGSTTIIKKIRNLFQDSWDKDLAKISAQLDKNETAKSLLLQLNMSINPIYLLYGYRANFGNGIAGSTDEEIVKRIGNLVHNDLNQEAYKIADYIMRYKELQCSLPADIFDSKRNLGKLQGLLIKSDYLFTIYASKLKDNSFFKDYCSRSVALADSESQLKLKDQQISDNEENLHQTRNQLGVANSDNEMLKSKNERLSWDKEAVEREKITLEAAVKVQKSAKEDVEKLNYELKENSQKLQIDLQSIQESLACCKKLLADTEADLGIIKKDRDKYKSQLDSSESNIKREAYSSLIKKLSSVFDDLSKFCLQGSDLSMDDAKMCCSTIEEMLKKLAEFGIQRFGSIDEIVEFNAVEHNPVETISNHDSVQICEFGWKIDDQVIVKAEVKKPEGK